MDKKAQKKALQKKNRFQQEIFQAMRLRRAEHERAKRLNNPEKPRSGAESSKEEAWSAKTVSIRNRLTDKKRVSRERWNRFSGTDAAGARGL